MGAKAVATETKPKKHRLAKFATYVSAASSILVAAGMTQASHVDEVFFKEQVRIARADDAHDHDRTACAGHVVPVGERE